MPKFFTYILLLINALPCFAQSDIYDLRHSKKYGTHLLKTRNYNWAAEEWERIVDMQPNDSNKLILLKTYRLAAKYHSSEWLSLSMLSADSVSYVTNEIVNNEYFKSLLLSGKYNTVQYHYYAYKRLPQNASVYNFQAKFLNKEWLAAKQFYTSNTNIQNAENTALILRSENLKYKNPAIAASLSVAVPGLGKIYAKDWKDGLLSFFIVGTTAWQAYEGFSTKGTRSVYGWIYGGMAAGFYVGTIYGSYKSAIRFNDRQEKELIDDAKEVFFSAY